MTTWTIHLPECDHARCLRRCGKHRCICDRLRAAQQRAADAAYEDGYSYGRKEERKRILAAIEGLRS
jgi:hypothetical protein